MIHSAYIDVLMRVALIANGGFILLINLFPDIRFIIILLLRTCCINQ